MSRVTARVMALAATARRRWLGPAATPGFRRDWPTAAATIPAIPTTSTTPSTASKIPSGRSMGKTDKGMAATGTLVLAFPALPSISKWTCHDPEAISQRDPVKKAGSAVEDFIASELGGCFEASPVNGVGVMLMDRTAAPELRTSIAATPGITLGGRMVT